MSINNDPSQELSGFNRLSCYVSKMNIIKSKNKLFSTYERNSTV